MPSVDWQIEGIQFVNCNCSYGCPCQFEATPTHGHCRGFEALRVDRGHFGETTLDGLTAALVYAWPGPIYEGNGEMQAIVDARATAAQRTALETILHGGETEEGKTHWWVYRAMSKTVHPTLLAAISFAVDIEGRTASVEVGDMLQSTGAPIRSPATGQEHRVRIEIPGGIEFERAEIGSGTTRATGAILLRLDNTYGQFNVLRHSGTGVIRARV